MSGEAERRLLVSEAWLIIRDYSSLVFGERDGVRGRPPKLDYVRRIVRKPKRTRVPGNRDIGRQEREETAVIHSVGSVFKNLAFLR